MLFFINLFIVCVTAQVTYTGCHNVTASTALVEWCYGPNGVESPLVTFAASTPISTPTITSATTTQAPTTAQTTAVTACHNHDTTVFCINGKGEEVQISFTATPTGQLPAQYTGCHAHGTATYCMDPSGGEVQIVAEQTATEGVEMDCHFHAGVEHCVPVGSSETAAVSCERRDRDYNIPVRVGTLFAVLVTSALGVFLPITVQKFSSGKVGINGLIFTFLKQFGTGIIIATAFVHLYTHASLMFNNQCLGRLSYEATTSAVVMAGIFISFLIEYISRRLLSRTTSSVSTPDQESVKQAISQTTLVHNHHDIGTGNNKLSVVVLEAGILFHSLILGLTLVVAGDSAYITLLIVIVFHQFFEGLALGSRIASIPGAPMFPTKTIMATAFALVTPIGMGIGIGVLQKFNGNDPSTIIAIGTLDAVSAGILAWVGVVEMWAADWVVPGGELYEAGFALIGLGGFGLISGLLLMSVLGKWA